MKSSFFLAVAAGALTALCYPKPGLCFLGWVSLVPLFYACGPELSRRRRAWLGFAAGFAFHAVAFFWVYQTCRFAKIAVPIGVLALGALSALLALNWAAALALAGSRSGPWRPWALAAAWTAVAFATERWTPRLFGDPLAYTQYKYLSLVQIASLAGPHALGFVLVAVNAALAEALRGRRRELAPSFAAALALAGAVWGYGQAALLKAPPPGGGPRVEILQPSVDQYRKWDPEFAREIISDFKDLLARPREEKPALVIWPESALPAIVDESKELPWLSELARAGRTWHLAGAVSRIEDRIFSAGFLIDPEGRTRGTYHKRQLVPFGEFVPFPWLRRWIGFLNELGDAEPGAEDQPLLDTPVGRAAVGLCYEATFPYWARYDAARGARLLINLTNDGWYKDTWGPYQHFYTNMFRAVETRTTVVRAGNNGISAVIDPWGRVLAKLDLNEKGRLDARLPAGELFPRGSLYVRWGDWLGMLCLLATLAGIKK